MDPGNEAKNMKIRLMTFHTPKNYGAVLQAYSLLSFLKKRCEDVKIIDYNTENLRGKYSLLPKFNSFRGFFHTFLLLLNYNKKKLKYIKFDSFIKNNLDVTERYSTTNELYSKKITADTVITGSDQVFNPNRITDERKAFYLDFVSGQSVKISYAASFGVNDIDDSKTEEIRNYLESFRFLSVRERSGAAIIRKLTGREAVEVLDPVFLCDKETWRGIAKPYYKKHSHYLLYYRLIGSKKSDKTAEKAAEDQNLKLIILTDGLIKSVCKTVIRDAGPTEFLSLILNADYIVTDSYHGAAFSVIFEKQFLFTDTDPTTGLRTCSLLDKLQITGQAYILNGTGKPWIEYEKIKKIMEKEKERSVNFIINAIGYES